jgi:hypothetical protein
MTGLFSLMFFPPEFLCVLAIYVSMPPSTGRPALVMKRASLEQSSGIAHIANFA